MRLRSFHSLPGTSEENTRNAIQFARKFRVYTLHKSVIKPSLELAQSESDTASESDTEYVAQRLRGIEVFKRVLTKKKDEKEEAPDDHIIAGTLIRGEKGIRDFFDGIKAATQENEVSSHDVSFFETPLFTFGVAFLGFTAIDIHHLVRHWAEDPLYTQLIISKMLTRVLAIPPHSPIKIALTRDYQHLSQTKKLLRALDEKKEWHFDSFDYRMQKTYIGKAWKTGVLSPDDLANQSLRNIAPFAVKIALQTTSQLVKTPAPFQKPGYIKVDRLLANDPETGEPTLAIFLRMSAEKPKLPKEPRKSLQETLKDLVKTPIQVPVR
jgi:hypothetical protein